MDNFVWVPFYQELASKLLAYKDKRTDLVNWIYSDLGQIQVNGHPWTDYLHMENGSPIPDIDPFSVYAIFNRGGTWANRTALLQRFKMFFKIEAEVPNSFDGIPTVNAMRSFYFRWTDEISTVCNDLWKLYEDAVTEKDIKDSFNKVVITNGSPYGMMTMALFWICPDRFLALDGRNKEYLDSYGIEVKNKDMTYEDYHDLLTTVENKMSAGELPCKSFIDLSMAAWDATRSDYIWMWNYSDKIFSSDTLACGSSAKGKIDFASISSLKEMISKYQEVADNNGRSIPGMYWQFIHEVKPNDIVVVFSTKREKGKRRQFHKLYGWGRFTSDCSFNYQDENPIARSVEWFDMFPDKPKEELLTRNALFFHKIEGVNSHKIQQLLNIKSDSKPMSTKTQYNNYVELLKNSYNLVLTGAPGTGKTHLAREIAEQMGAETRFVQFHPSYDYTDFVEGLRPIEKEDGQIGFERKDGVFKEFCREAIMNLIDSGKSSEVITKERLWREKLEQFVEDSIENGTVYETVNGSSFIINDFNGQYIAIRNEQNAKTSQIYVNADDIVELLTNEVELTIVRDIRNHFKHKFGTQADSYTFVITKAIREMKIDEPFIPQNKIACKPYVFIIDEINRGEASKIFGELFYAIDPGYRGKTDNLVQTQYQNLVPPSDIFAKGFYVPENVYILATMNDIDRSVESMDFAMRRRFTWMEITPSDTESMLNALPCVIEAKETMARLNEAITATDGLGAAFQIGPAYFLKLSNYGGDFNLLWKMNIEPLLKEYLRGFRKDDDLLQKFHDVYFITSEQKSSLDEEE